MLSSMRELSYIWPFNLIAAGVWTLILPGGLVVISAVGKKKKKVFRLSASKTGESPSSSVIPISLHCVDNVINDAAKRKHERPQNTNSVKQLSEIASTEHTQYHPAREPLHLQYIHYTICRGEVKEVSQLVLSSISAHSLVRHEWQDG